MNSEKKSKKSPKQFRDKSKDRSINSSLSNRSNKVRMYHEINNTSNAASKLLKDHQPKLSKLNMSMKKKISSRTNQEEVQSGRHLSHMKIIEENSFTNIDLDQSRGSIKLKNAKIKNIPNLNINERSREQQLMIDTSNNLSSKNQNTTDKSPLLNSKQNSNPPVSYKKLLEEFGNENFQLKLQMKNMIEDQNRKTKKIDQLKIKTAQAQSDKIELMRDLATYDSNFCENSGIRSTLLQIHKRVELVRTKFKNEIIKDPKKNQSWLNDKCKTIIFDHLTELCILKRERGSMAEMSGMDIFIKANTKINSRGGFNQIMASKTKKMQVVQNDNYEEQEFVSLQVSGISSMVQANLLNGVVKCFVSTTIDSRQYKLEIKPLNSKQDIQMRREIERLYFKVEYNTATNKSKLCLKARESYESSIVQQVLQLKGCKYRYCEGFIDKEYFDQQENSEFVYASVEIESIEINLKIKRKGRSNLEILNKIEKDYCVRYNLNDMAEILNIHKKKKDIIPAQKWLNKIKNHQNMFDQTIDFEKMQQQTQDKDKQIPGIKLKRKFTVQEEKSKKSSSSSSQSAPESSESKIQSFEEKKREESQVINYREMVESPVRINIIESQNINPVGGEVKIEATPSQIREDESVSHQDNENLFAKKDNMEEANTIEFDFQKFIDTEIKDINNIDHALQRFKSYNYDKEQIINELRFRNQKSQSQQRQSPQIGLTSSPIMRKQGTKNSNSKQANSSQQVGSKLNDKKMNTIDQTMRRYEFLYHFKWFKNNKEYFDLIQRRIQEIENKKRQEIEKVEREKIDQQNQHDLDRMVILRQNLEVYRDYFRGPTQVLLQKQKIFHQDEFAISETDKIKVYAFEQNQEQEELLFLINRVNTEVQQQNTARRSSAIKINSIESLVISQRFLDGLDLNQYDTIQKVKDGIEDFLGPQGIFRDIVKHHIFALLNENKQIFKTFEQQQVHNMLQLNPIRKMESELKSSFKTYDKTSSDYGDTSMNESYSKYMK